MRDRLIELIKQSEQQEALDFLTSDLDGQIDMSGSTKISCSLEYLVDFLLENGVVVPPCKVGTLVNCIVFLPVTGNLSIAKGFIKEITIREHEMNFHIVDCQVERYSNLNLWLTLDEIKRLAFWGENAEVEAEKALRGEGE